MISREGAAGPAPPSKKLICSLCASIFWSKFSNIKRPALVIETKTASDFLELITIRCSAIQLLAELAASIPDGKSVQKTCECHNNSKVASTDRATENYLSQVQYLSDIWLDEYGYYVHAREGDTENKALRLFLDWLISESVVS